MSVCALQRNSRNGHCQHHHDSMELGILEELPVKFSLHFFLIANQIITVCDPRARGKPCLDLRLHLLHLCRVGTRACMFETRNRTERLIPTWPSLYDPLTEFYNLEHRAPIQPDGRYLTHAGGGYSFRSLTSPSPSGRLTHHLERVDVFIFTFYWSLVFHSLLFLITGGVACFNIIYPSRRHKYGYGVTSASMNRNYALRPASQSHHPMIPLSPLASGQSPDPLLPEPPEPPDTIDTEVPRPPQPRKNVHRSRVTYAIFTLLAFLVTALAGSLVESAVVGYVLWAVFSAAKFNVST